MTVKLYESPPSRSQRVRWVLQELDVPFDVRSGKDLLGSDELKCVHPQGKIPAIEDDGRPLFESVAICTWLADKHADKGLIAPSGTWERALHDQWCAFTLSEVEAHLWTMARNAFIYSEDQQSQEAGAQAHREAQVGLKTLDDHLGQHEYMVGDTFSATDIIVGFVANWAKAIGLLDQFSNVSAFNDRMLARPHCPMSEE